jgi:ammonia channel protein AmtB
MDFLKLHFLLQCCTCLYCASIASAGGFERNKIRTDVVIAVFVAAVLYPFPVHWCWHQEGFLSQRHNDQNV